MSIGVSEAALARALPQLAGGERLPEAGRLAAAVCVPLRFGGDGHEVWVIKRPDGLRHHSRELAFPGGKPEPGDSGLLETALRETEEELGIERSLLRPLGAMAPVPTATSLFTLSPFVAAVDPAAVPRPEPNEVAALVRAPLEGFFDGSIPFRVYMWGGEPSPIFDFTEGSMYGASAHILLELLEVCAALGGRALPEPERARSIPWA